jgi:hypothetical protein
MNIIVRYQACDGFRETRTFKTLAGARRYAHDSVGPHPELGSGYAVSDDGIGVIQVEGARLADLFPPPAPEPPEEPMSTANTALYEAILTEALEAAQAASKAAETRMGADRDACGFAWCRIDGNEPLARFCRAEIKRLKSDEGLDRLQKQSLSLRYGDKGYPTGWEFWNPGGSNWQSVGVKEAGARAFRDALAKYGTSASVGSRLD